MKKNTKKSLIKSKLLGIWSSILALVLVSVLLTPTASYATNTNSFDPGNIISDQVMFAGNAMSASEVQIFLDSKVPVCTLGSAGRPAGGWVSLNGVSVQLASSCLKSFSANVPALPADSFCASIPGGNYTAAQMIFQIGLACNVSQKALLVLMEKEQSLVTDSWPTQRQLDRATGFNCPDTAPCSNVSTGLFKQIYSAARQFQVYGTGIFRWFPIGQYSNILFQANNPSCGSSPVLIQNRATAALYYYTPYQPNNAALANLYGTGDACSAYGNRNFWRIFTDWFGSTTVPSNNSPSLFTRDAAGNLWLYSGNRKGGWNTPYKIGVGWQSMVSIIGAGDINGDANRDIIALDTAGTLLLYPTDGKTGWGQVQTISTGWNPSTKLVSVADFDENGSQDLITKDPSGFLFVSRGNDRGNFFPPAFTGTVVPQSMDSVFFAGDWNGDGHQDIIGKMPDGGLWLYQGTGKGSFKVGTQIGNGWQSLSNLNVLGDFDGDGNLDLSATTPSGLLLLYRGNGIGGFKDSRVIGQGWQGFNLVTSGGNDSTFVYASKPGSGDLNSDSHRDVTALLPSGEVVLYPGNGLSGWLGQPRTVATLPGALDIAAMGDWNFDGVEDFVFRDTAGRLFVTSFNSNGMLSAPVQIGQGWAGFTTIIGAGDLNSDGVSDLLAIDIQGNLFMFTGNGSGALNSGVLVGVNWQQFLKVFNAGDFDSNGAPDLMAIDRSGKLWLYPNTGANLWGTPRQVGQGWLPVNFVFSPGDFSGDGTSDVIARGTNGSLILYQGNGLGGWKNAFAIGQKWGIFQTIQ